MLIKKTEGLKNNSNLITNTLSNQNIFKNNFKKNSISICSSFRENNGLGNKENINNIHNNNVLTSTNLSLL